MHKLKKLKIWRYIILKIRIMNKLKSYKNYSIYVEKQVFNCYLKEKGKNIWRTSFQKEIY